MACFIRIANLPPEVTEEKLLEFLANEPGFADRTSVKLINDGKSAVAVIGVPWERHIGDAVARHFNGHMYNGRLLSVRATAMFEA